MTKQSPVAARSRLILVMAAVAVVAAGVYGTSYIFFRPAGPAAVSASSVAVSSTAASASAGSTSDQSASSSSEIRTGVVDTSVGSFDDFSSSFVGYRVQEELAGIGASTAVGRTPDVSGTLTLGGTTVTHVEITADLTTLVSDDDRRDGQLQRQGLETDTYPTAIFVLTDPIELPDDADSGETITVDATGELTLHGVTNEVRIPIEARLDGSMIVITGSIDISFADYGMEPPSSMIVLSVDDHGIMEFQLFFTEA